MNRPSPLELMAFVDGELDESRAREVQRWLEEHADDAALVERMADFYEATAQAAAAHFAPAADIDLADDILAAIEREAATPESGPRPSTRFAEPAAAGPPPALLPDLSPPALAASSPLAPAVAPLPAATPSATPTPSTLRPPAVVRRLSPRRRDLAAVAFAVIAAAAAALIWWQAASKAPPRDLTAGALPGPSTPAFEAPSQATANEPLAAVDLDDGAVDDGSAITSVEFGANSGAIFYVRGATNSSAVLWIDDEATP